MRGWARIAALLAMLQRHHEGERLAGYGRELHAGNRAAGHRLDGRRQLVHEEQAMCGIEKLASLRAWRVFMRGARGLLHCAHHRGLIELPLWFGSGPPAWW